MVSDKKIPKYLEISNNRFIFASQSKRFRLMDWDVLVSSLRKDRFGVDWI